MNVLTRATWTALAVVLLTGGVVRAQVPTVLEQVPADAPVVVAAPSLSALGEKAAMLNQRLNLNEPTLEDPIGTLRMMLGMQEGVDEDGAAAFVLLGLPDPQAPGDGEPPMAMVIPVTDYEAFLGNFDAAGDGVIEIEVAGEPSFVKQVGAYAIVGSEEAAVEGYEAAGDTAGVETLAGEVGLEAMTGSDLVVVADLEQLGPVMIPAMMQGMMMAQQFGEPEAQGMLQAYADVMESVLTQGGGVVYGLRVSEDGVGIDTAFQFREGTELAEAFAEGPAERVRLDRIPNRSYLVAGAADLRSLPLESWMEKLREVFEGDDEFNRTMRQMFTDRNLYTANSQMLFDPQFGLEGSLFNGVTVALTDDPEAAKQALQDEVAALDEMGLGNDMAYETDYTADAMEVAGRSVDRYSIRMDVPPEAMGELGPAAMFVTQDMGGHVVTLDDALIATNGTGTELLEATLALADNGDSLEDDAGIQGVREHLLERPAMETFLSVGSLMEMVNEFLVMFNPDAAIDVPADLPPVGVSGSLGSGGTGWRVFVPMPVIDTVREAYDELEGPAGQGPGGTLGAR